ncbi:hypothetical protein HHK36_025856 [Tetracentron sinense]|uniref:Uncharacterized protein n=1 Tax=Tetracentron sinense TaxID=13715 RepID=A0A835D3F0_TETSI|nr:hypothetical protein HHK36_025856 [Tetracentron sinense]
MFPDQIVMEPLTLRQEQHECVIQMCREIEEEHEDVNEGIPVSVFNVPKTLISIKQEAYIPQQVALGPYHHLREELNEMEHYKLSSARTILKKFRNIKFHNLVEHFAMLETKIRAYHHRYLHFGGDELAWMFAVDASFLLEYLQTYDPKNGASLTPVSSMMSHLVDYTRRELNGFYDLDKPDEALEKMLMNICKDLCPIKILDDSHIRKVCLSRAHLLELLYYMVAAELPEIKVPEKAFNSVSSMLCFLNFAPIQFLGRIFKWKNLELSVKLPWEIIKCVRPVITKNNPVQTTIERLVLSVKKVTEEVPMVDSQKETESPLIQELVIPNVTNLSNSGIKFHKSKGGLGTIEFDKASTTFYLPNLNLNENSVVLRNLIAYEASIAPDVMIFTRYTELMKGIIDSKDDVKLLREAGIVLNRLKSDEEVTTLWNCIANLWR